MTITRTAPATRPVALPDLTVGDIIVNSQGTQYRVTSAPVAQIVEDVWNGKDFVDQEGYGFDIVGNDSADRETAVPARGHKVSEIIYRVLV